MLRRSVSIQALVQRVAFTLENCKELLDRPASTSKAPVSG